ncbi:MAG: RNA polymerase sigma factor [Chloroflexota bacterium]|nr:MAG: RNA polymerase sigma factor [Chloroflexota bacterium]
MTADLIRQAQAGDRAAFERLIRPEFDRLYAAACRLLRDRFAAEDAAQDALLRCWRDLRGLRSPDRFHPWLHRLLVNACLDQARRTRRRPVQIGGEIVERTAGRDDLAGVAENDALERAFRALPMDQRVALVLTHYLGYTAPEAAAIVGVPTGTIYSRVHVGSRAMRAALGPAAAVRPALPEISR